MVHPGPTPVSLRELTLAPIADTRIQSVVRLWNSLASLPNDHRFAQVAHGDCLFGVAKRSPTWDGSVMKAVRDIGYPLHNFCPFYAPIAPPGHQRVASIPGIASMA